ncbi:aminotransferase class V-fold PLP-dependent enzyme [Pedobacter metabolipauper]|uniref:dTDP-4-amino-4,6-dideoxygalactose transaminase n=1 Tax=Pedobacter metabolipauper TaxID=425513 RepID=A0A4R6SZ46_9SPHI|nr:aminotransferase class V-fold PLP-dependent enzyme [Pedobacter metabolipauper]TDQ11904.1 dTDP-4-amino-4,6-dideoxygalactose transaminase [Pedobacter metabolipauper]
MIPRGKLDISFSDIGTGIYYCISKFLKFNRSLSPLKDNTLLCLSVRTGFDLTLSALKLPAGSEIIVTNINIPDMFAIIKAHGLVAVPIPLCKHTLGISARQVEAVIGPNTKAILVTHLFGAVMDTEELADIARRKGLLVIEDCAQAFIGSKYTGNKQSDVVMYSFGLIKTNTTLTGAMLQINNQVLCTDVSALNDALPRQKTRLYLKKLFKGLLIKILTLKIIYSLLYRFSRAKGIDFDDLLSGFSKGFPGTDVMKKIRFRPCVPNEQLMHTRLTHFSDKQIKKRKDLATDLLRNISPDAEIGKRNINHAHWVLPVQCKDPELFISRLRANGFDATAKASSLVQLPASTIDHEDNYDLLQLEHLVYLPMFTGMSKHKREELNLLINQSTG